MNTTDKTELPTPDADTLPPAVFRMLGSLRFALAVVLLIAAACVAGTLIPQGDYQVAQYLQHHPAAQHRMEMLGQLGLTHVFFSQWFVVLLCALAASLIVCTCRRFQALRGAVGPKRIRVLGSSFTHVSLLLVLAGGVIRAVWGETGYIEFREGDTVAQFSGARGPVPLPFSVRLVDFTLQLYGEPDQPEKNGSGRLIVDWPDKGVTNEFPAIVGARYKMTAPTGSKLTETCRITIQRYVPDFCINNATHEVQTRSEEPNNPAIFVETAQAGQSRTNWIFARFPDFTAHVGGDANAVRLRYVAAATGPRRGAIKSYKSTLQILENEKVVCKQTVEVNMPFSHGGYTFYQSGYNPQDLKWTSLQVVRDPGVIIVYIGFMLMMVGLTMVFWVAPMAESGKR